MQNAVADEGIAAPNRDSRPAAARAGLSGVFEPRTRTPAGDGALRLSVPSFRPRGARAWIVAACVVAIAVWASASRIVLAPGFELYLGPLFYLFAYRCGGLRLALPLAFVTMLPSYFWWGHVFTILLALAQVVFIDRVRWAERSLALPTLFFSLTIAAITGTLFLHLYYHASTTIILLSTIRKLINDVMMAGFVDLAFAIFRFDLGRGTVGRRLDIRLADLLPAVLTLMVMMSAQVLFVANARRFPIDFETLRVRTALEVRLLPRDMPAAAQPRWRSLADPQEPGRMVAIASRAADLRVPAVRARLGCTKVDDGAPVTGPNDRNTFAYWVSACSLGRIDTGGATSYYLYSMRPLAERAYKGVLVQMVGPGVLLAIAVLLELFLIRAMRRSVDAWDEVVEAFGKTGITAPQGFLFGEFKQPIDAIVAANNRVAAVVAERDRLANSVRELNDEMDLRLAADLRFDADRGTLSFTEVSLDRPNDQRVLEIHPNDRTMVAGLATEDEAFIEFRLAGQASPDWYLLATRDLLGPGQWRSGWVVRLRQAKIDQPRMLHQARLVDLGGMASAISHELKQPLFTIMISAENGRLLIDQAKPDSIATARSKFDRITEQVERARDIIARISRYARIEDDDPEPVDLGETINAAAMFMRPLLVQNDVNIRIDLPPDPLPVLAPRVGLEQIFVNAIQNAVDAINARREKTRGIVEGEIVVGVTVGDDGLRIRIADNGTGLTVAHPEAAFDAFVTTKGADQGTGLGLYISRQIVMEIGGKIAIASRESPQSGAEMTIDLPLFIIARKKKKQQPGAPDEVRT